MSVVNVTFCASLNWWINLLLHSCHSSGHMTLFMHSCLKYWKDI